MPSANSPCCKDTEGILLDSSMLLRGNFFHPGLEVERMSVVNVISQDVLALWWGTKCVFSLFLKVVIQDYGCWLGSLKIESTEVLKFVLFYFYFLNCLVTFQDDKWNKNAFVLPL